MASYSIASVGTALADYSVEQHQIRDFAAEIFREGLGNLDRLLPVFENGAIRRRSLARPLDWYGRQHSFAEANACYAQTALALAARAAREAMEKSCVNRYDVGLIVFVSSTGIATPTLDAQLIQELGLPVEAVRLPIWGLGCAGGVAGIARTAELARALDVKAALLVSVELCSLTFQRNDLSKANLVGTSIFADGAAAVVLVRSDDGPVILAGYSHLFPGTGDIMGWDVVETGMKVRFSRSIPILVRSHLPGLIHAACAQWSVPQEEMRHYIVHPGGLKVLEAYEESLGLPRRALDDAYGVLADCGNMSSVTVLFVLERFLARTAKRGVYGLMLALGPGFSAEQVLFRW